MQEVEDFMKKMEKGLGLGPEGQASLGHMPLQHNPSSEKLDVLPTREIKTLACEMVGRQAAFGNKKKVPAQAKQAARAQGVLMAKYVEKTAEVVEKQNLNELFEELSKYVRVLCVLAAKPKPEEKHEFAKKWSTETSKALVLDTFKRKNQWLEYMATSIGKTPKARWLVPNLMEVTKDGCSSKKISGNMSLS